MKTFARLAGITVGVIMVLNAVTQGHGAPAADLGTSTVAANAVTSITDMKAAPGNSNILASGVPAIPADLQARVGQYLNARMASLLDVSEDGGQVLISTRFGSTAQLHVVEQPMGARTQLTFAEEPISSGHFEHGDTQSVYYTQDAGGGEFHQIYRLDRKTGRSTMLTDGKSKHESLLVSPASKSIAFASTARNGKDTDVYFDAAPGTGAAIRLTAMDGTWAPVDFSPDGNKLLVVHFRAIDDSDLFLADIGTSGLLQLTPKDGKGSVGAAAFSADGKSVYLVTDRYSDFNELYRVDLANPSAAPAPLSRSIPWNVENLAVARDGSRVAICVNEDGFSRIYLLDPRNGKLAAMEIPPGVIGAMAFPAKRSDVLMYAIDTPKSPTDVWQLDVATGKSVRWTRSEVGGLDTSTFVEPKLVRYPSDGGVTVPAFLYRPASAGKGRLPVVVVWHGGPEGQSRPNYSSIIQLLVNEFGMAVLMPNVRGSDGYGKAFLAMDNGVKREQSLKDIGATLDWIARQPELDASRIGIYGGSYGGYMTLATLAFYPDRIRAGVDVVGISNIVSFLENTQAYRRDLRRAEYGDERVAEVRAVLERISPLNYVSQIKAALFVQQGKNDPRVPQSEAEQVVRAVREGGRDCWYVLGLNEGHGFAKKENRDWALVATLMFLKEQLLPAGN